MKQSFEEWKRKVDVSLEVVCGLGCDDLPDWNYWDAWSDGMSPGVAVKEVLRESGWGNHF